MNNDIKKLVDKAIATHNKGGDVVPVSGKVFDEAELSNLIQASLEGWWTEGKWTEEFENKLKKFLGVKYPPVINYFCPQSVIIGGNIFVRSLDKTQII